MKKVVYIIVCIFMLSGCSNFLEEYSQDKAYIRGYEDLDELLLGNAYFLRYKADNSWQYSGASGELYYPWIHVMADELSQQTGGRNNWSVRGAGGTIYGYHTWQYRVYEDVEGKRVWDDGADFRHLYSHINACNMILEEAKAFENMKEEKDVQNVNRIKGECYFLRGSYYFLLVNFYGKPYVAETAERDPAIPIKISNYVEDKYYNRNSVAEVYKQVISDLLAAEKYLINIPKRSVWRANINAVRLMLSRVYLYMCSYEEAKRYAALVIENGPQLEDLNVFWGKEFLNANLSELIFSTGASSLPGNLTFYPSDDSELGVVSGNDMRISDVLYEAYNPQNPVDLRLRHFVVDYEGVLYYKKLRGEVYEATDVSDVFLMRIAEAWLNLAEATACIGDDVTAQNALNTLREKRIQCDAFDKSEVNSLTGEALVFFIRKERQRELCLEGHRWFDLRRYQVAKKYPQDISVEHIFVYKEYNPSISEYETLWTRKFVLSPGDPAWVLPLPKVEIDKNTGMIDNPRNERMFENVNY